jgi:hypothetical protein
MVNSGWLGPETSTNPAVEGTLANNRTMAMIKLRSPKLDFENNCLIPPRPDLNQPSLAFKGRWLYGYGAASHQHIVRLQTRDHRCGAQCTPAPRALIATVGIFALKDVGQRAVASCCILELKRWRAEY